MRQPVVYFRPLSNHPSLSQIREAALKVFRGVVENEHISLIHNLPLKVHTGQPGNVTFIKPECFTTIIDYVTKKGSEPYYVETGMVTGPRSKGDTHRPIAYAHGFSDIPFTLGDGEDGEDHIEIPISGGKHFASCKIGRGLATQDQVIVMSHFKGHCATGFGAAIKMLGIGFASRRGKIIQHTIESEHNAPTIDWSNRKVLYWGDEFSERVAEYALGAVHKKTCIYVNFAINITANCDCDGHPMIPVYKDIGVFASTDPVAIDKACFDILAIREGKIPFDGKSIFTYAEKLGLGSSLYILSTV